MIQHDKANNRIEVQIYGMKNRWIYYLEHDGLAFIEHLRTENDTVNLGHKWRWGIPKVEHGKVTGLPMKQELKRGDADKGIYGFRVALSKIGGFWGKSDDMFLGAAKNKFSSCREFFDAASVRVHLKENKVDYIEIPNTFRNLKGEITKIHLFNSDEKTVVLKLKNKKGSQVLNFSDNMAKDRKLFLGGEEMMGMEGKKLLKFLVDHAGDSLNYITDETTFTDLKDRIDGDWDLRPAHQHQGRRLADRLASGEANCKTIRC